MSKHRVEEMPKLWTRSFTLLVIGNLFVFMSFQMLLPTLPPQIKAYGATELEVGLVTSLFCIAAVLIRPFIGFILESSKRKKLVLVGALSLLAITTLYSLTSAVVLFLFIRFIHGIAWGWSTTANGTAAVELVPEKRLGEGLGYFGLSMTIGMIIAPSLGILLYQTLGFQELVIGSTILGTIAFLLLASISYSTPESVLSKDRNWKEFSLLKSTIDRHGRFPAIITLIASFGYGSIVTFILIFAVERDINEAFLFYLCNAVMATIARPFVGKRFDRKGPYLLVFVCSFLTIIGFFLLSYTYSVGLLIISGLFIGAGFGSLMPILQSWVLQKTPKERRGVANGMFYSSIDLGLGISGIVFGFLSTFFSIGALFQISTICFAVVMVLTWYDFRVTKKQVLPNKASLTS
ncbi:MFS transporter [Bacillus kexueae]|uniref:MFS transporter n=1 Tax=Aeribacillus kexueae TaxID=2078952 RepID=UPI001FAFEEA7|nr:MFS transporter [Bacillus kexueae]